MHLLQAQPHPPGDLGLRQAGLLPQGKGDILKDVEGVE